MFSSAFSNLHHCTKEVVAAQQTRVCKKRIRTFRLWYKLCDSRNAPGIILNNIRMYVPYICHDQNGRE